MPWLKSPLDELSDALFALSSGLFLDSLEVFHWVSHNILVKIEVFGEVFYLFSYVFIAIIITFFLNDSIVLRLQLSNFTSDEFRAIFKLILHLSQ